MRIGLLLFSLCWLAGCSDFKACNAAQSEKAAAYFARCLQGDGYTRPSHEACADRALSQKFCPVEFVKNGN